MRTENLSFEQKLKRPLQSTIFTHCNQQDKFVQVFKIK